MTRAARGVALVGALLVPVVVRDPFLLGVIVMALAMAIAVYGMDLLLGRAGHLNLAHAGFFAIGGYGVGILTTTAGWSFWVALPAALLLTMSIGWVVGWGAHRARADAFAILTLAVGVILRIGIERWEGLTGGTDGLVGIPPPPPVGPVDFGGVIPQYYLVLGLLLLSIRVVRLLVSSPFGLRLEALHHGEPLARAVGIDPGRTHRAAFVAGVGLAGLGGALHAVTLGFVGPGVAGVGTTFLMLVCLMVGGVGTLPGPLVGSLGILLLVQGLQLFEGRQMMALGALLVLLVLLLPGGVVGLVRGPLAGWWGRVAGGEGGGGQGARGEG